jgi:hypothetical protein
VILGEEEAPGYDALQNEIGYLIHGAEDWATLRVPKAAAACLSVIMTGIFVVGILERRDKTIWRLGYDSAAAIVIFLGGFLALSLIA